MEWGGEWEWEEGEEEGVEGEDEEEGEEKHIGPYKRVEHFVCFMDSQR